MCKSHKKIKDYVIKGPYSVIPLETQLEGSKEVFDAIKKYVLEKKDE